MPIGENKPYTQLDFHQVLKQCFDENQDRLRVDALVSMTLGEAEVIISHIDDSIKIGDGTDLMVVNADGSINVAVLSSALPSGASTSALQTTGNSSLSSIDGKLNSLGQKTMAGSVPVTLASDQSTIAIKEVGPTRTVFVFGANSEHIPGIRQVIWDYSANYTFLASAENLDIYSDNINDTLLGSGARTIKISGLDNTYEEIEEVVDLDGLTPVTTTLQFLRRNRITVDSVGASGSNIGNITIEGSSVQGYIASGINRDRSVIYTIPANYTGGLKQIFASVGPSSNAAGIKYGDLDIYLAEIGQPYRITNIGYIMSNGTQYIDTLFGNVREFPEKTDLVLMFTTEKEGAATSGFFEIFLEPN